MIEIKQNGLCISCGGRITRDHAVVSSGNQDTTIINIAR